MRKPVKRKSKAVCIIVNFIEFYIWLDLFIFFHEQNGNCTMKSSSLKLDYALVSIDAKIIRPIMVIIWLPMHFLTSRRIFMISSNCICSVDSLHDSCWVIIDGNNMSVQLPRLHHLTYRSEVETRKRQSNSTLVQLRSSYRVSRNATAWVMRA